MGDSFRNTWPRCRGRCDEACRSVCARADRRRSCGVRMLAQQPVFRGGTELISVAVSVVKDRAPLRGLRSADFVMLDNGLRQQVEAVALDAIPIDVTIIVATFTDDELPEVART